MTIKHGCNAPRWGKDECVPTIPCIECGYWEKEYPQEDDRGWEQGFKDGQASALTDLNLLETKIRNDTLTEMIKLSMMIEEEETERWNRAGRPKNDGYINGSHSGYGHALRDMRQWIDRIKMANGRVKV